VHLTDLLHTEVFDVVLAKHRYRPSLSCTSSGCHETLAMDVFNHCQRKQQSMFLEENNNVISWMIQDPHIMAALNGSADKLAISIGSLTIQETSTNSHVNNSNNKTCLQSTVGDEAAKSEKQAHVSQTTNTTSKVSDSTPIAKPLHVQDTIGGLERTHAIVEDAMKRAQEAMDAARSFDARWKDFQSRYVYYFPLF
jgi:hypothetical protein